LLSDPNRSQLTRMLKVGERVTWPALHMVENRMTVEVCKLSKPHHSTYTDKLSVPSCSVDQKYAQLCNVIALLPNRARLILSLIPSTSPSRRRYPLSPMRTLVLPTVRASLAQDPLNLSACPAGMAVQVWAALEKLRRR
jgi:hypothetical protein